MPRVDGPAEVTGQAVFAADHHLPGTAHAALVTSPISKGCIVGIDPTRAETVPGLLAFFTHADFAGEIRPVRHAMAGGYANSTFLPLGLPVIAYHGQIVALAVAETAEAARQAADALDIT